MRSTAPASAATCAWLRYPRSACFRFGSFTPSHGLRGTRASSTAAPMTCRSKPNAFSIVGTPTSAATIAATHARTAAVFTSPTATSAHRSSTREPHVLRRDRAVLGAM
ncbi:hypothetical protein [Mycolicibacterium mageritense]|uniref:hypothetical protein n=1 Tax=Mycolicibacterium mageritense TaxID=53462 RepID=UPI00286E0D71|nr:hypothetical protein [Mycolicibacterium mageritense]